MVKLRRHNTGASLTNSNNAPIDTPKSRGQTEKKSREPRHEGPDLEPAIAQRVLNSVLGDYVARRDTGYLPDPKTGYTDVAAQTLDILDAIGLRIPGYVTIVAPNGGGVSHIPRDQWDVWQHELYQARLRRVRRRDAMRGEVLTKQEEESLAENEYDDDRLLHEGIEQWIARLRAGAENWEEEDE